MYRYLLAHEKQMLELLESKEERDWEAVKAYHAAQIGFLQHERLVHLIVTLAFAILMLGSFAVSIFEPGPVTILLDLILILLEVFYIVHYYRLENGVQRLYWIYNGICERTGVGRSSSNEINPNSIG